MRARLVSLTARSQGHAFRRGSGTRAPVSWSCPRYAVTRGGGRPAPQTKHNKPVREDEPGKISERESPIHHSNAMLYSTKDKVASRIGYRRAPPLRSYSCVPAMAHRLTSVCRPRLGGCLRAAVQSTAEGILFGRRRVNADGKKVRYLKKNDEELP